MIFGESIPFNPAMTVKAYAAIPHDTPIFDGRKAWQKISSLGFKVAKAADCPAPIQAHFRTWLTLYRTTILADFNKAEILFSPAA